MRTAETNQCRSRRHLNPVIGIVVVIIAAGAAPWYAHSTVPARLTPKQLPGSSGDALVDGYRAFRAGDYGLAVARLKVATQTNSVLRDYALYFLSRAQQARSDLGGAAAPLTQLIHECPTSALTSQAELALSEVQLGLKLNDEAAATAAYLTATTPDGALRRKAQMLEARTLVAEGKFRVAYDLLIKLRRLDLGSDDDEQVRRLSYEPLREHPGMIAADTLNYHRNEAALLLSEGQLDDARMNAVAALALSPSREQQAELTWIVARSLKRDDEKQRVALIRYLELAPAGPKAPNALELLGLLYWRKHDSENAIVWLAKVPARFPSSDEAPASIYGIARIYEEGKQYDSARAAYRHLLADYPQSKDAPDGRFRIGWTYYMTHHYGAAVEAFKVGQVKELLTRDLFDYWHARALEKNGNLKEARVEFLRLAESTASDYYPALASIRLGSATARNWPTDLASNRGYDGTPKVAPAAEIHLARWQALNALGLKELEPYELEAIEAQGGDSPGVSRFVLARLDDAHAWNEAIHQATLMQARGQIESDVAKRALYPRAYWEVFRGAAEGRNLNPWLVLALARQESLFDPNATSADAWGLMQVTAPTADKFAREAGVSPDHIQFYDPETNVALGTTYLQNLMRLFRGDQFHAVAAYNGGEQAVQEWISQFPCDDDEWVENIGYNQTRDYVKKVIGGKRAYQLLPAEVVRIRVATRCSPY
jgi:soluble lytic murein transglycosylase-like protein/TolA-binding protein